MGFRDKARLRWRGHNLAQGLVRDLRTQASQIIIVRARPRGAWKQPNGSDLAWDRGGSLGPLSGLAAGLKRSRKHWCLCLPVDSLAPPKNLAAQLARGSRHGGYAKHADDHYYLHLLLARTQNQRLKTFQQSGGRSAANACRQLSLPAVAMPRHPSRQNSTVWSINTPAQWQHVQRQRRPQNRRPT